MRFTYINADNSAGDATALGAAKQDVYVKKIIFGLPTDGGITIIHNAAVAAGHASGMGSIATANAAIKHTQATHAAGTDFERFIDFTAGGSKSGLQVDGGSVHTDEAQVTVIWEPVDEAA